MYCHIPTRQHTNSCSPRRLASSANILISMHAEDASVQFGESFFSNVAQRIYPCMQRWLDSVSLSRLFLLRRREKGRSLHLQACYMQRVYCARTHTRQHLLVRDNILSIHAVYIMLYTYFFFERPSNCWLPIFISR
jgi:hypothetical protein